MTTTKQCTTPATPATRWPTWQTAVSNVHLKYADNKYGPTPLTHLINYCLHNYMQIHNRCTVSMPVPSQYYSPSSCVPLASLPLSWLFMLLQKPKRETALMVVQQTALNQRAKRQAVGHEALKIRQAVQLHVRALFNITLLNQTCVVAACTSRPC